MLSRRRFSDEMIIQSIKEGDKNENRSIEQLLNMNRGKIKAHVLSNSGGEDDAELVLTEGVTQLIFNIRKDKFQGQSSLDTYLFVICKRVWIKVVNKESRYVDFESNYQEFGEFESSPLKFFNEMELTQEVKNLLGVIGDSCKTVLELWSHHFSMKEIANRMNFKNAQIAMNKKNKCLSKLKGIVLENSAVNNRLRSYIES